MEATDKVIFNVAAVEREIAKLKEDCDVVFSGFSCMEANLNEIWNKLDIENGELRARLDRWSSEPALQNVIIHLVKEYRRSSNIREAKPKEAKGLREALRTATNNVAQNGYAEVWFKTVCEFELACDVKQGAFIDKLTNANSKTSEHSNVLFESDSNDKQSDNDSSKLALSSDRDRVNLSQLIHSKRNLLLVVTCIVLIFDLASFFKPAAVGKSEQSILDLVHEGQEQDQNKNDEDPINGQGNIDYQTLFEELNNTKDDLSAKDTVIRNLSETLNSIVTDKSASLLEQEDFRTTIYELARGGRIESADNILNNVIEKYQALNLPIDELLFLRGVIWFYEDIPKAQAIFERLLETTRTLRSSTRLRLAFLHYTQGKFDEALKIYQMYYEAYSSEKHYSVPNSNKSASYVIYHLYNKGQIADAIIFFEDLPQELRTHPSYKYPLEATIYVLIKFGKVNEAEAMLNSQYVTLLTENDSDDISSLHWLKGQIEEENGRLELALGHYQDAISINREGDLGNKPQRANYLVYAARVLRKLGRLEVASRTLEKADSLNSKTGHKVIQARIMVEHADLSRAKGQYEEAQEKLIEYVTFAKDWLHDRQKAYIFEMSGDIAQAMSNMRKSAHEYSYATLYYYQAGDIEKGRHFKKLSEDLYQQLE